MINKFEPIHHHHQQRQYDQSESNAAEAKEPIWIFMMEFVFIGNSVVGTNLSKVKTVGAVEWALDVFLHKIRLER